jgi:hypothetical protein
VASKRPSSEVPLPAVSPLSLRVAGSALAPLGVKLSMLAGKGMLAPR